MKGIKGKLALLVLVIVVCNYVTSVFAALLKLPFFLDTWATSLGAIVGGLVPALIGGIIYNLLMAFTLWSTYPLSWIWSLSSILVALLTFMFYKKGYLDINSPKKILSAGITIGICNAILTTLISLFFFQGLSTHEGTKPLYNLIELIFRNSSLSLLVQHVIIEITDKTASLFIAVVFASHIGSALGLKRK